MFNLFGIPFPALPSQFLIHRRRSTPRTFGWVPALSFSVSCVDVLAGGKDMLERIWKSESHSWNMHAKRVKDFEEPLCLPWTTLSYCCLCPSFAKACVTWIHLVQVDEFGLVGLSATIRLSFAVLPSRLLAGRYCCWMALCHDGEVVDLL